MATQLRLLVVEDSEDDALLLVRTLRNADFAVSHERVDTAATLKGAMDRGPWDIVVSDYSMPAFDGTAALDIVRARDGDVPFIFVSGSIGEDTAVAAMRAGAQDYVMKGNLTRLAPAIQRELADRRERKKLQAQFLQAQKMESVGRLASGIAHDFNNLLTVIMSHSEFLLADLSRDDPRREEVVHIRSAAEAATNISRQLLVFSRPEVLRPQIVAINDVVRDSIRLLERLIGEDIRVVLALDPHAGHVEVDPGLLAQAVLNLAINARDAMPKGGKLVIESHNSDHETPEVTLSVSDSGIGMNADTQAHMFEPFFTTKAPGKGTGLGLAQVYTAVTQYKGALNVYSELGVGTTFQIHLPRVAKMPGAFRAELLPPPMARDGEVVLLAEDAPTVRAVARQILERCGYTVLEAPDGVAALYVASRYVGPIHLLITDLVMPGMQGKELAERMRVARPLTHVLFASGYTDNAARHLGVLDAGSAYLHKPFTPDLLARKVREAIDGAGAART